MNNSQKTKSRAKLYNAISGAVERTGAGGRLALGSIQFANIPVATETVTIGGYVFEAQAGASEAPGTSAGTAADPHLFQAITDLATAGASLAAQVLAETETTGKWGYLYPDDSEGCDFTTDTLTLQFWPGTWANDVTLAGSAGDETLVQPVTASLGRNAPSVSIEHKSTLIDSTGGTQNKEYWTLEDGINAGDTVTVMVKTTDTGDTPTLVGHLSDAGTANVEALFANENGMSADFIWTGTVWELKVEGNGTALAFTPSA